MYACGLRIGEAAKVEISDIENTKGVLHIIGKGNKERRVPLPDILDRPAMALDADQGLDRSPCRTPGGEVGEIAVGDITPDQQASCPKDLAVMVGLFAFEIGQFEVAPVVQSRSFGSGTGRQTTLSSAKPRQLSKTQLPMVMFLKPPFDSVPHLIRPVGCPALASTRLKVPSSIVPSAKPPVAVADRDVLGRACLAERERALQADTIVDHVNAVRPSTANAARR